MSFKKEYTDMIDLIYKAEDVVILDIETTGFSPVKGGKIIEIAAVKLKNGSIEKTFNELVNPSMKIPKKITELTGITNEMVEEADSINKVLRKLFKFIGNDLIVIHNAQFDWEKYILYYAKLAGIVPLNEVICTLMLSKKIFPKLESYKLESLMLNIVGPMEEEGVAHRALYDVKMTIRIYNKLKEKIDLMDHQKKTEQISFLDMMGTAPTSMGKKINSSDYKIRNVNAWEKKVPKKHCKRLYVYLNCGQVYYDFNEKDWGASECEDTLDFERIEALLLKHSGKSSLEEIFDDKSDTYQV